MAETRRAEENVDMPSPPSSAPTGAGFAFCADSNLAHFCDPLNSIEIGGVCCEPHRHNDAVDGDRGHYRSRLLEIDVLPLVARTRKQGSATVIAQEHHTGSGRGYGHRL